MKAIATDSAPKALGPYSQAVLAGANLYLSGQIALDPKSGEMVQDTITAEVDQIMSNIEAVLAEARYNFMNVVKTTIFLTDMNDFAEVNAAYGKYFMGDKPARSCVQVAALPKGARVEIEVVAIK